MDPLSQIGALGPVSSSPMLNPMMFGGNAASVRATGGCCGASSSAESAMMPMMMMQMMLTQMLQILVALMMGQQQGGGSGNVPAMSGVGGGSGGGSSPASAGGGISSTPSASSADQGEIKNFIREAAGAYGADPNVLTEIARRESSFNTGAVNNWDSNAAKGTPSKGLFQFIEPTFNSFAPKAKAANPKAWEGLGELNWMDWRQQALTAAWAIANGYGSHWSTYKAAGGR